MKKIKIGGIIQNLDLAHVGVHAAPDHPGVAGKILGALGSEGINIQFIVHSVDLFGRGNIVFCIDRNDLDRTLRILERIQPEGSYEKVTHHAPVGIISIFGPHFREKPAIAGTMFATLGDMGINILAISTSISTLSCVIDEALLPDAVKAICQAFELP
jgi:aspartate kinase